MPTVILDHDRVGAGNEFGLTLPDQFRRVVGDHVDGQEDGEYILDQGRKHFDDYFRLRRGKPPRQAFPVLVRLRQLSDCGQVKPIN